MKRKKQQRHKRKKVRADVKNEASRGQRQRQEIVELRRQCRELEDDNYEVRRAARKLLRQAEAIAFSYLDRARLWKRLAKKLWRPRPVGDLAHLIQHLRKAWRDYDEEDIVTLRVFTARALLDAAERQAPERFTDWADEDRCKHCGIGYDCGLQDRIGEPCVRCHRPLEPMA